MRYFILSVALIIGVLVSLTIAQVTDTTHQEANPLPRFSMGFYLVPYKSQTVFEPQLNVIYPYPILDKNLPSPYWGFQYDFGPDQEQALFAGGNFEFRLWQHLYLQGSLQLLNRSTQVTEEILDYEAGDDTTYIRSRKFTSNITLLMPQIGLKYYFKRQIPRHVAPYAMLGFGKQIPFVSFEYTVTNPDTTTRRNLKDFLKDINRATLIYVGAGTEYLLSSSLALFTRVWWEFSFQKGVYIYQQIFPQYHFTRTNDWRLKHIRTYWSIGIRMYF